MRIQRITTVALVACIALGLQPAWAQWVVNDPSTTARNTVTAVLKSSLLQTLNLERDRLRRMARTPERIHESRQIRADRDPPRWRTHAGSEDFLFSRLPRGADFRGPTGYGLSRVSRRVADPRDALSQLSPDARRALLGALATLDAADATAIAGTTSDGTASVQRPQT